MPTAMARANGGSRTDDLLDAIAELQRMIDASPAMTLEDAAVKLRRLGAYVERGQPARLLAGGSVGRRESGGEGWPVTCTPGRTTARRGIWRCRPQRLSDVWMPLHC